MANIFKIVLASFFCNSILGGVFAAEEKISEPVSGEVANAATGLLGRFFFELSDNGFSMVDCRKVFSDDTREFLFNIEDESRKTYFTNLEKAASAGHPEENDRAVWAGTLMISKQNIMFHTPKRIDFYKIQYSITNEKLKGISVNAISLSRSPINGDPRPVKLFQSSERGVAIAFQPYGKCPRVGFYPNEVEILFTPNARDKLLTWVHENSALLQDADIKNMKNLESSDELIKNGAEVYANVGHELHVIELLRKQDWVIDATMRSLEYGPPFSFIDLPDHRIFAAAQPRQNLREIFEGFVRVSFPSVPKSGLLIEEDPRKSAYYSMILLAPVTELLPAERAFTGYWLKAKVDVEFYPSGADKDSYIDRIILQIADGYLPKWPITNREPPPESHTTQFYLKEDGQTKYDNFYIYPDSLKFRAESLFAGKLLRFSVGWIPICA